MHQPTTGAAKETQTSMHQMHISVPNLGPGVHASDRYEATWIYLGSCNVQSLWGMLTLLLSLPLVLTLLGTLGQFFSL